MRSFWARSDHEDSHQMLLSICATSSLVASLAIYKTRGMTYCRTVAHMPFPIAAAN